MHLDLHAARRQLEQHTGKQYSWAEIARETGLHRHTIERIAANETTQIRFDTLERLLQFFHDNGVALSLGDLFEYSAEPQDGTRVPVSSRGESTTFSQSHVGGIVSRTMPQPDPAFTGRMHTVETVLNHLAAGGAVRISGVNEVGGLGRTQVALFVAERLAFDYPDEQLYVQLHAGDVALSADRLLATILHTLEPDAELPRRTASLHQRCYDAMRGRRGILLLDDLVSVDQVRPLVPPPDGWIVLVTSRHDTLIPSVHGQTLDVLTKSEAISLVRRLLLKVGRRADATSDDTLHKLVAACNYIPMALRVAAKFLQLYDDWPLHDYIATLAQKEVALRTDASHTTTTILSLFVEQLQHDRPDLLHRWYQLAVLPAYFVPATVAAVWNADDIEVQTCLDELVELGLVTHDSSVGAYFMPRVFREYIFDRPTRYGTVDWSEVRMRHARFFADTSRQLASAWENGGEQAARAVRHFYAIWGDLESAWRWLQTSEHPSARPLLSSIPKDAAGLLSWCLFPQEHRAYLKQAVHAARQMGDDKGESFHLGNLGKLHQRLNDFERAIDCYVRALERDRSLADSETEGIHFKDLGLAYLQHGNVHRAIECLEHALTRVPGNRSRVKHQVHRTLGIAYEAAGDLLLAAQCFDNALWVAGQLDDQEVECFDLCDLGRVYHQLGQFEDAIGAYEKAQLLAERIGLLEVTGDLLGLRAGAYRRLGDLDTAVELFEQALSHARERGDVERETTWIGSMGTTYLQQGKLDKAISNLRAAVQLARRNEDQSAEAIAAWNLGLAYEETGNYAQAVKLMQRAIELDDEGEHSNALSDVQHLDNVRDRLSEMRAFTRHTA